MFNPISLFTGSPWVYVGVAVACLAAGGTGGYIARGVIDAPIISQQKTLTAEANQRTDQCKAIHEKGRADEAEKVIAGMLASAKVAAGLMDDLTKKAAARKQTLDQLLKDIANAPASKLCGGSAAELAFRRSVQPRPVLATP